MANDTNISLPSEQLEIWNEFRCLECHKLLGKQDPHTATIEIKCLRCGKLNTILEDNNRQIFLTDAKGKILYVNDQVINVTGYTAEEVIGKTPAIWGKQMPESFYQELWDNILNKKKSVVVRVTNRKKNGKLYKAMNRISPILNEDGNVLYFLSIQTLIPENNNLKKPGKNS